MNSFSHLGNFEKIFLSALKKNHFGFVGVVIAILIIEFLSLSYPLSLMAILDKSIHTNSYDSVLWISTLLVFSVFLMLAFSIFRDLLNCTLSSFVMAEVFGEINCRVSRLNYEKLSIMRQADLLSLQGQIAAVRNFISNDLITIGTTFLYSLFLLLALCFLNIKLALLSLAVIPVFFAQQIVLKNYIANKSKNVIEHDQAYRSSVVELFENTLTLKTYCAGDWHVSNLNRRFGLLMREESMLWRLNEVTKTLGQWLWIFVSCMILFFGANQILDNSISVGQLMAFNIVATRCIPSILNLTQVHQNFMRVKQAILKVNALLSSGSDTAYVPNSEAIKNIDCISVENLSFGFNEKVIFENLNFSVKRGEILCFLGRSGIGKSTIISLISKLHSPWSGRILFDGKDIQNLADDECRSYIAVASQNPQFFHGSLRENLTLGFSASDSQLFEALNIAGCGDFFYGLVDGLDTLVLPGGRNFSGGQRQRLALARAYLRNSSVLILDEPTSAFDPQNVDGFVRKIQELKRNKIIIIVTHSENIAEIADKIVRLTTQEDTQEDLAYA